MKIQAGYSVLLTGASGGLGVFMARAFAALGTRLALVAYPGAGLDMVRQEVEKLGGEAISLPYDLRDPAQRHTTVDEVRKKFGGVDILINNAGLEVTSAFHELTETQIHDILVVNLEAALMMTRLVLPGMLERKRGHIVNVSSLAGKAGPAFQEPYAATKAGLIAFTFSLRATYRGTGVSASAIVPGFVEAGIYAKLKQASGCQAPALLGTSTPETVARGVLRAVERDLPEVIINPIPVRPLFAVTALFPSLGEWATRKTGAHDFFRRVATSQKHK